MLGKVGATIGRPPYDWLVLTAGGVKTKKQILKSANGKFADFFKKIPKNLKNIYKSAGFCYNGFNMGKYRKTAVIYRFIEGYPYGQIL